MSATPLPFVFPYALGFWLAYVWAFYLSEWNMIRASKVTAAPTNDVPQDSLRWLMSLALVAQLVAFAAAFWTPAQFPAGSIEPMLWLGIVLLIAGSFLRRHCFRMLGQSFTIDVRAFANQSVVERGAYALVRHPGYTAGIVMLVAVGLALGSYISLLILITTALFVYLRRIAFEERALEATLGEKYRIYAASRKRLIPYVY
ncbi:MAG: isoprenylcysteine carboxylmethyltransferase family protein [Pseudomonadota bacterium]